jgi:cytochrome c-type biogenesis protein CcmH/NrfF
MSMDSSLYTRLILDGGPFVVVLAALVISVVIVAKYIAFPAMKMWQEISATHQSAMAELRAATQNNKETATSNAQLASELKTALMLTLQLEQHRTKYEVANGTR